MPRAHPSRRVQISKDENGNIGFIQGDNMSNELKKKPGKFKQLKRLANNLNNALEDGTKTIMRGLSPRQFSVKSNDDYKKSSLVRTSTLDHSITEIVPEYDPKQLRFFQHHANLTDENSIKYPKSGVIQELISRGQHALETSRNAYSTYTFKGWKIFTDAFFYEENEIFCLGITKDKKWIVQASCYELFRKEKKTELPDGLMVRLCGIWSAARVGVNWADSKGTSSFTITDRNGIMKSFTLATESNTLRNIWKQTVSELSNQMGEMQIEIISQNFHDYIDENPPSLFLPTLAKQLPFDDNDIVDDSEEFECQNVGDGDIECLRDSFELKDPLKAHLDSSNEFQETNDFYVPKITRKDRKSVV